MAKDIHIKVDDVTFEEWQRIGENWHGIRSKLLRRKVQEVIDEVKKNPFYKKSEQLAKD